VLSHLAALHVLAVVCAIAVAAVAFGMFIRWWKGK